MDVRGLPREKDRENRERDGDTLYDRGAVAEGGGGCGFETTHRWQRIEKRPVRSERNERQKRDGRTEGGQEGVV